MKPTQGTVALVKPIAELMAPFLVKNRIALRLCGLRGCPHRLHRTRTVRHAAPCCAGGSWSRTRPPRAA